MNTMDNSDQVPKAEAQADPEKPVMQTTEEKIQKLGKFLLPADRGDWEAITNSIRSLNPKTAAALVAASKERGGTEFVLSLRELESLSVETAKELVKGNLSMYLGMPTISPESASILAKNSSIRWVYLTGLASVQPEEAKIIGDSERFSSSFPALKNVSPDALRALTFRRLRDEKDGSEKVMAIGRLVLGLSKMTAGSANVIGSAERTILDFPNLETISPEHLQAILKSNPDRVYFDKMKYEKNTLLDDVLRAMPKYTKAHFADGLYNGGTFYRIGTPEYRKLSTDPT